MSEIDALILRNIKDLDGAVTRLRDELQKQIGQVVNEIVEAWAKKEDWAGTFEWYGDEDQIWIAAAAWRGEDEEDEQDYDFWFTFQANEDRELEHDPNGDQFWLTSLCAAGRSVVGFGSHQDTYKYPKGRKWKAKIEPFIQDFVKIGFTYEDSTAQIFLPITVDQERLACAIENEDVREALDPITETLGRLIQAKPIIDQLRAAANNSNR